MPPLTLNVLSHEARKLYKEFCNQQGGSTGFLVNPMTTGRRVLGCSDGDTVLVVLRELVEAELIKDMGTPQADGELNWQKLRLQPSARALSLKTSKSVAPTVPPKQKGPLRARVASATSRPRCPAPPTPPASVDEIAEALVRRLGAMALFELPSQIEAIAHQLASAAAPPSVAQILVQLFEDPRAQVLAVLLEQIKFRLEPPVVPEVPPHACPVIDVETVAAFIAAHPILVASWAERPKLPSERYVKLLGAAKTARASLDLAETVEGGDIIVASHDMVKLKGLLDKVVEVIGGDVGTFPAIDGQGYILDALTSLRARGEL